MTCAEALSQCAFEVIEEGMFVFLEPAEPGPAPGIRFWMAIEGAHCAEVGLAASEGVARQLAAGMLGMDADEVSQEDLDATVAEALNIVAGKVVATIAGSGLELELRPPVGGGHPKGAVVAFDTDEGQLQLWYAA